MPRPKITRKVGNRPRVDYFKPRGIPLRALDEVRLAVEELEALRLSDLLGLNQTDAAARMDVSRPTFARVLRSARKKVADALVNGKSVLIEGGEFALASRQFKCTSCSHEWDEEFGTGRPESCPSCMGDVLRRTDSVPRDPSMGLDQERG